jgi:hypothetical protein
MSGQIIAAIDDILGRLRESERQFPSKEVGDFFENPAYAHLHVRTDEMTNLHALLKSELSERYGPSTGKIALLESIRGSDTTRNATLFRTSIDYLTSLRTFVLSTLPAETSQPAGSTISVTVHGDMVGNAIGGTNAQASYSASETVTVDPHAIDELLAMIRDLTAGRDLDEAKESELADLRGELEALRTENTAEPSRLQATLMKIASFGSDMLSKTTAAVLSETAKRLLFGLP